MQRSPDTAERDRSVLLEPASMGRRPKPLRVYIVVVLLCISVPAAAALRPLVRCLVLVGAMSAHRPRLPIRAYLHYFGDNISENDTVVMTPEQRPITLRVYTPQGVADPPVIVLAHGLQSEGARNAALNYWAGRMAQCGFAVVLPNIESERQLLMDYQGVEDIGWSARWAAQHFHRKATVVGISFAGGLALAAAEHPEWSRSMAMVLSISGHSSVLRLSDYYLRERVTGPNGVPYAGPPPENGPFLIAYQYLGAFVQPEDVAAVRAGMLNIFRGQVGTDAGRRMLAMMTPRQTAALTEIKDGTSDRLKIVLRERVAEDAAKWATISPAAQVTQLRQLGCPVFLLHGRNDRTIPPGEAQWTATAQQYGKEVHLSITSGLRHGVIDSDSRRLARLRVGVFILRVLLRANDAPMLDTIPAVKEQVSGAF